MKAGNRVRLGKSRSTSWVRPSKVLLRLGLTYASSRAHLSAHDLGGCVHCKVPVQARRHQGRAVVIGSETLVRENFRLVYESLYRRRGRGVRVACGWRA